MHYQDQKIKGLHPLNLKDEQRFIPDPIIYEEGCKPVHLDRVTQRITAKSLIDKVYIKYRDKIKKTIWLVNRESKIVVFRFEELEIQAEYINEKELRTWLNIQLLKYVGITLDLYYILYHSYQRKITLKDGSSHYLWNGLIK